MLGQTHRSPPSVAAARKLVRWAARSGVAAVHGKGHVWFRATLLPALAIARRLATSHADRLSLSGAYYVVGDVHDFNGAPRAAVAAYRSSLRFDPEEAASWREIGGMLEHMGKVAAARRALRHAVTLDPADSYARDDLAALERSAVVAFLGGDRIWEADELLARNRIDEAWSIIRSARSMRGMLCMARVLGAQGDASGVLRLWSRMVRGRRDVELRYGDWFFLPEALFDSPSFWRSLEQLGPRLAPSVFPDSETLDTPDAKARQRLEIRYHLARTRDDVAALSELSRRHPKWKEPRDVLRRISKAP